jgi:hypothetical protein
MNNFNGQSGSDFNNEKDQPFDPMQSYAYQDMMQYKSRGWSVASFVLSIISVVCCCAWYVSCVLAILAIIFAIVSRRNLGYFDGFSVAGLVIGIFGLVFSLFVGFLAVSGIITEFTQEFENALEEIEGGGTTDSF